MGRGNCVGGLDSIKLSTAKMLQNQKEFGLPRPHHGAGLPRPKDERILKSPKSNPVRASALITPARNGQRNRGGFG